MEFRPSLPDLLEAVAERQDLLSPAPSSGQLLTRLLHPTELLRLPAGACRVSCPCRSSSSRIPAGSPSITGPMAPGEASLPRERGALAARAALSWARLRCLELNQ